MKVEIEGVNQKLMFNGGGIVENWLVLALPTGERIHARVGEADLTSIMDSVGTEFDEIEPGVAAEHEFHPPVSFDDMPQPLMKDLTGAPPDEEVQHVPSGAFEDFVGAEVEGVPQEEAEDLVDWEQLPEEVLPAVMKSEMRAAHIAQQLPSSALIRVTDQIAERMMAKATLSQPPQHDQRTRVMNAVPPRRTVATNEYGYPKVAGVDNDPGEFAHDADEDGVGQL